MSSNLKIVFITLPQRENPDFFPPYGAMAVVKSLRKNGYPNTSLLNLDVLRLSRDEAVARVTDLKPDIIGISAPVSTSYDNCKYFASEIKRKLPNAIIALGGNLTASAELIVKKTEVDYCVIGEGEKVACELFKRLGEAISKSALYDLKGLAFIDNGEFIFTGYADQISREEIFDVDWDDLDSLSLKHYFRPIKQLNKDSITYKYLFSDSQNIDAGLLNKSVGVMLCSKGCVGRCTYCHRFIGGIRIIPCEIVIKRIKLLVNRFNIGAIIFADECFGANRRWLVDFCEQIKHLNLLWKVGGMRVDMVNPEIINMMKAAGCRSIIYGMEAGSQKILNVMEKKVDLLANYKSAEWTLQSGLYTIPQLVIGMPGETSTTIAETAEFIAHIKTINREQNPKEIGINFAQALPGTPLYEFGRSAGKIGLEIDAEEDYLLQISDREAADESSTINFTDFPRLILLSWPFLIRIIVNYRYIVHFGKQHYRIMMASGDGYLSWYRLFRQMRFSVFFALCPSLFYRMRRFVWIIPLISVLRTDGWKRALLLIRELVHWWIKGIRGSRQAFRFSYKSLRKILSEDLKNAYSGSKDMEMLRRGR